MRRRASLADPEWMPANTNLPVCAACSAKAASEGVRILGEKPVWPVGLVPLASGKVIEAVLRNAGARPNDRDETDRRIVRQIRLGEGRIIDSQDDVEGYPEKQLVRRVLAIPEGDVEGWLRDLGYSLLNEKGK